MTPDQGQSIGRTDAQSAEALALSFNGVALTERQVWEGMRVAAVRDGQIQVDDNGEPLILGTLLSGVPLRIKFYPVENGEIQLVGSMEDFNDDIGFMPTEVFLEEEAPVGRNYAVFKDGEFVRYKDKSKRNLTITPGPGKVELHINDQGQRTFEGWQSVQDFVIPEGSVLIPISR